MDNIKTSDQGSPPKNQGLLLVDHGSIKDDANSNLHEVVKLLSALRPDLIIEPAHMDIAEPDIEVGLKACVRRGARSITVVPYMLAPGRHSTEDIPRIVQTIMSSYPEVSYRMGKPLGVDIKLAQLVIERAGL